MSFAAFLKHHSVPEDLWQVLVTKVEVGDVGFGDTVEVRDLSTRSCPWQTAAFDGLIRVPVLRCWTSLEVTVSQQRRTWRLIPTYSFCPM